jgi:hypothetical protein
MTKKLMPPERAAKLLRLCVRFSVTMLTRFLDPWSRHGASILVEYVDSMWETSQKKSEEVPRRSKDGKIPPSGKHADERHSNESSL